MGMQAPSAGRGAEMRFWWPCQRQTGNHRSGSHCPVRIASQRVIATLRLPAQRMYVTGT